MTCLIAAACYLSLQLYLPSTETKSAYAYKAMSANLQRLARSIDSNSIVFIGSSSIQGMDTGSMSHGAMNFGISGEKLSPLLQRMQSYSLLNDAKALVFMAGFNDMCSNISDAVAKFERLLRVTSKPPVFIVSLQPASTTGLCKQLQNNIQVYNTQLQTLCLQAKHCIFINTAATFSKHAKTTQQNISMFFETDGIHLSPKGYDILENEISYKLKEVLN